jgi:hypothetical protein
VRESVRRWGRVFIAQLGASLTVVFLALLLLIPGIWKAIAVAFATVAAVRFSRGDPLRHSSELVRGRWWPVAAGVLFTTCVACLPVALVQTLLWGFIKFALSANGFATTLVSEWVGGMAGALDQAFEVAMFYGAVCSSNTELKPMQWLSDEQTADLDPG